MVGQYLPPLDVNNPSLQEFTRKGVMVGGGKNAAGKEEGKQEAKSEEVNGNSSIEDVAMPTNSNDEVEKASIETVLVMDHLSVSTMKIGVQL